MSERFIYVNGIIKDTKEVQNDCGNEWNLNTDDGRIKLCKFLNWREDLINDLNNEESRLLNVINDCHKDISNYHNHIHKQDKIIMYLREICELYQELTDEVVKK